MERTGLRFFQAAGQEAALHATALAGSKPLGWRGFAAARGVTAAGVATDLYLRGYSIVINLGDTSHVFESAGRSGPALTTLPADAMMIRPPGDRVRVRRVNGLRWGIVEIPVETARSIVGGELAVPAPTGPTEDAQLATLMHALLVQLDLSRSESRPFEIVAQLVKALAERSGGARRSRGLSPTRIHRLDDFINDSLGAPLRVPDMARVVELSPAHFAREFKRATGQTPVQHLMDIRLHHARRLLGTGKTVAGTAASAGFADQSHLCRRFRQVLGISPRDFAALVRSRLVQASWEAGALR